MEFLTQTVFNVRMWIWMLLLLTWGTVLVLVLYWNREALKRFYYALKCPHKLICVVIHYPNNRYKNYWRLLPDSLSFSIDGRIHRYDDKHIVKSDDMICSKKVDKRIITYETKIDNVKRIITQSYLIKQRFQKYPEIHYHYKSTEPIDFTKTKEVIVVDSKEINQLHEANLATELLTLEGKKQLLMILIGINVIIAIVTCLIGAKIFELI